MKNKRCRQIWVLVVITLLLFDVNPKIVSAKEDDHHGHDDHEDSLSLSPEEMKEFSVTLATAGPGVIHTVKKLPGEIIPNADTVSHIVPRYPGIVKGVKKNLGDIVKKGDVLAVVESNDSLTDYDVTSLIDGTIIEKHIVRGESVQDNNSVFVIADLSTVWVDLTIYQKNIPYISVGQHVILSVGFGIPDVSTTILYVSPIVDKHTRTALARLKISNDDGNFKPGMFVTGAVMVNDHHGNVVIPRTAIQNADGRSIVFIHAQGGFQPSTVVLGQGDDRQVDIVSGLNPGQEYVSDGGFILKAEMDKGSFGHAGHAH